MEQIQTKIQGARAVAAYLAENLEALTIADLRERLGNLRDLLQETQKKIDDFTE